MSIKKAPAQLDIHPAHLEIVRAILKKHIPQYEVWAFGSRTKGTAKKHSDLDLCIKNDIALSFSAMALLQEDFAESDLPWQVDIIEEAVTSAEFLQSIKKDKITVSFNSEQ